MYPSHSEQNRMETPSQITTVLLIDPNNDDRQDWMERLTSSSAHYKVFEARDAETGLALYYSERVDCVVMELHLPDMSGFQVLMRLNPIIRGLQTPVVALSHFILPSIAEAAKKLGAQSYLIKSQASGDDLDRAIQKAIAGVGVMRKEVYVRNTNKKSAA
jgi:DNA-binding NarL/FixJ family response regulator